MWMACGMDNATTCLTGAHAGLNCPCNGRCETLHRDVVVKLCSDSCASACAGECGGTRHVLPVPAPAARYGLLSDGTVGHLADGHCTAEVKLELLIRLTTERRERISSDPSIDILSEEELGRALRDWKGDYEQWMHPETLRDSWAASQQEWHQLLRRAFRTFLFQLAGSYELTVFFLAAPFSGRNLELFRSSWNSSVTNAEALKKAKDALREAARAMRWVRGQEKEVLNSLRGAM